MDLECTPISTLPGVTRLFCDYLEPAAAQHAELLARCYPAGASSPRWMEARPPLPEAHRERLAAELLRQADLFSAGPPARENIERLRHGAAAVVTGQQVGLFGGPLLTLFKAATAIRRAKDASAATGRSFVPVFWLASEDHDIAEVDQVWLLDKQGPQRREANLHIDSLGVPAGSIRTGGRIDPALAWAEELLGYAPICEVLRRAYTDRAGYQATLASGFGTLLAEIFAAEGLVVLDAASREIHALGAATLQRAIEDAGALEQALLQRSRELEAAGYHAQVKVAAEMSLLFLITPNAEGVPVRQSLRRTAQGGWKAGGRNFTSAELLEIAGAEPERLSPNALLRPVFQDAVLPTAAYVGGPAEIAYFAQSAVVYERVLGRVTPVLPRLSATLVEPSLAAVMARHELHLQDLLEAGTVDALAQRMGARAMPIEAKRRLAAAGNAMDSELTALTGYLAAMSPELGRSAEVSASKMRYQMNRLRRLAANFEVQKEASLRKHAAALMHSLLPEGHLQERLLAGVWFLARYAEALPALLVEQAGQECPGHRVIRL